MASYISQLASTLTHQTHNFFQVRAVRFTESIPMEAYQPTILSMMVTARTGIRCGHLAFEIHSGPITMCPLVVCWSVMSAGMIIPPLRKKLTWLLRALIMVGRIAKAIVRLPAEARFISIRTMVETLRLRVASFITVDSIR